MSNKVTTQLVIEGKNNSKKAFDEAEGSLNSLGASAKAAAGFIAGALSVSFITEWIQASTEAIDKTDELAERVGIAAGEFAGLQYAAKFASIESEALASTLTKFNQTIAKAAAGSEKESEAFTRIGIKVRDAAGNVKGAVPLLSEVADRFAELPDGPQKAALAIELFGKQGAKLLPLLNMGSAGLKELTDQAKELGLVLSDETYEAAAQFNDNLDVLGAVASGAGQQVAADLLPALNDITGLMIDVSTNTTATSTAAQILGGVLKTLATIVVVLGVSFKTTGDLLGGLFAAMSQAATGDLKGAWDTLKDAAKDYAETTEDGIERVADLWNGKFAESGKDAAKTVSALEASFEAATTGMGESVEEATQHMEQLKGVQKELVKDAQDALRKQVAEQRKANAELKKAQDEQVQTAKRYKEALEGLQAGPDKEASYGQAQALKVGARNALQQGDVEEAKRQAQAALDVLMRLSEEGANTYGFEGFIKELQGIEQAADQIKVDDAKQSVDQATAAVETLKAALEPLKDVKVTINLTPEEIAKITADMQKLATQLGQTLTIPAQVVPVQGDYSEPYTLQDPGPPPQQYATGGHVRGPGSGTSDSILARLSNGEYVMRAAAVQQYGTSLLDRMNGLRIPRFADGGLVDAAMSVPGGGADALKDWGKATLATPSGDVEVLMREDSFARILRKESARRGSPRR